MDNLARQIEEQGPDALIREVMETIGTLRDPRAISRLGNEFIRRFPPDRAVEVASAMTFANPFFLPEIPAQAAERLALSLDQFVDLSLRAKLAARHAGTRNVLVACAPKSASTFIQDALARALELPSATLFTASLNSSALGANLREQEPDELALIRNGLNTRGYVAQHHVRATPYLSRQLAFYRVTPIVTHRNIFDTIVSLDDMLMEWRARDPEAEGHYYDDANPRHYATMEPEDRYRLLASRWPAWLTQFYLSWKAQSGGDNPALMVSYEQDFLADKTGLASRIIAHLGLGEDAAGRLADAFGDTSRGSSLRLNKGVAGRGAAIPDAIRARIVRQARLIAGNEDIGPLLDG